METNWSSVGDDIVPAIGIYPSMPFELPKFSGYRRPPLVGEDGLRLGSAPSCGFGV